MNGGLPHLLFTVTSLVFKALIGLLTALLYGKSVRNDGLKQEISIPSRHPKFAKEY